MSKYQTKSPKVALTHELFMSTIDEVSAIWQQEYTTKADRQFVVANSAAVYNAIIRKFYTINGVESRLEDVYGSQFAQDVTDRVVSGLYVKA